MKLLKKTVLLFVFFVTLSQAIGNSNFQFEKKSYMLESHANNQADSELFSLDLDESEDEFAVNRYLLCPCISVTKEAINLKEFYFHTTYNISFWQPPKKS